jgi:hypothetical protein
MNPKQRQKWAKIRMLGKFRYVLGYGILLWGIPTGLCYAVLTTLTDNGFSLFRVLSSPLLRQLFVAKLIISLILFPICGCVLAWWLWHYWEKKYSEQ